MTMTHSVAHHVLSGLAKCQGCGNAMSAIAESDDNPARYICPRLLSHGPAACASQPVHADTLDRLVVGSLLDNMLTEENIQDIVTLVKRDAASEADRGRARARAAQQELSSLNRQKANLLEAVEHEATTYSDAAKRVREIAEAEVVLEAEAEEARKLANASEYAAESEERIRRYATELSTYLRESNAPGTREFLHTFIEEVLIGPGAATIRYPVPTRTGSHSQTVPL